ncbi:tRNA (adenosine(37)-N6)-threonylcarbamoyltransferase complex ATPase subunit type 1 TsaE [Lysinimonas soli]|uniref:tRNA threonylcarbamoyladenosine biosynthesis protein TsaE n=1 Tax=Lysinimonas soli TaxID=1074233 RepID=A0ABW0NQK6_9MICO
MIELTIPDSDAMEAFGARLAPLLRAGDVVLLNGELGAGKTTMTRGLGAALGARGAITSPTFVLAREHPTALGVPLVHVDAYRLGTAIELDDLDLDWDHAIVVVEWGAGKVEGLVDSWLSIDIQRPQGTPIGSTTEPTAEQLAAEEPRRLTIEGVGGRGQELEARLLATG